MELSHYVKVYPYKEKPGYRLLYSTKKSSKVLLKEGTFNSIINGSLSAENKAVLSKLGMIVPDAETERKEILGLLDMINAKSDGINISVIINLDCNFNCVYCYEGAMKGKFYMNGETAELLLEFIGDKFTDGKKTFNIDFYGGEPLLSADLIKNISARIKSFIESRGAKYTFTLVTNGSLLTRQVTEELVAMGLTGVKITLDGPHEIHNISRPFKSGTGSFDVIVRNIRDTCDLIKVAVGGNYQKNNFEKFPALIDYLEKEGLTPDRIYELKFDPAMNSPKDSAAVVDFTDGLMSVNEPWVIKPSIILREEILKRGYNTPKITPSPCQVELDGAYVVNYDGVIYKCPSLIGKKGFEVGNLRDGLSDYSESHKLNIWKNKECVECEYLPLCFGGCRYMSYVRDGSINNVDCRKPYLDAVLETLIKQDVRYGPRHQDSR